MASRALDLNALLALQPQLLVDHVAVADGDVSDVFTGLALTGSLVARLEANGFVGTDPTLTATLENSSDGTSWSTLATFPDIAADGVVYASGLNPLDQLRLSYAVADGAVAHVKVELLNAVAAAPAGGSSPVATWLYASGDLDLAATPNGFWVWDTVYDNIVNENTEMALPDGIGLDPAGIGTDTLTTTEDGIWSFSLLAVGIAPDATWSGALVFGDFNNAPQLNLPVVTAGVRSIPLLTQVLALPAGTGVSIGFATVDAATAANLIVGFSGLSIVRLA